MAKKHAKKQPLSYVIAFVAGGKLHDFHVSDDLEDHTTWDYIDFSFPESDMMFFFPRDEDHRITKREANRVLKYVQEDMEDFCIEGDDDPKEVIEMKLMNYNALVIGWAPLKLPRDLLPCVNLIEGVREQLEEKIEEAINNPLSEHEMKSILFSGKARAMLEPGGVARDIYEFIYRGRIVPFGGCNIPEDAILAKYAYHLGRKEFQEAGNLLADHYGIEPSKVVLNDHRSPGPNYVSYSHSTRTIHISTERIPEAWQQFPAFLMGFFLHLSHSKNWSFDQDIKQSQLKNKAEAENFTGRIIRRLIEIGINPMKSD